MSIQCFVLALRCNFKGPAEFKLGEHNCLRGETSCVLSPDLEEVISGASCL